MDKAQIARPCTSLSQAVDHGSCKRLGAKEWLETYKETRGKKNDWDNWSQLSGKGLRKGNDTRQGRHVVDLEPGTW